MHDSFIDLSCKRNSMLLMGEGLYIRIVTERNDWAGVRGSEDSNGEF